MFAGGILKFQKYHACLSTENSKFPSVLYPFFTVLRTEILLSTSESSWGDGWEKKTSLLNCDGNNWVTIPHHRTDFANHLFKVQEDQSVYADSLGIFLLQSRNNFHFGRKFKIYNEHSI